MGDTLGVQPTSLMSKETACGVSPASLGSDAVAARQGARPYWPQLDGIRALAFLLVFFHHCPRIEVNAQTSWLVSLIAAPLNQVFNWGWTGVDLFFVLSGFLITTLLLKEKMLLGSISFRQFFIKRALRIWPVYYFVLIACCVVAPLVQGILLTGVYREFFVKQLLPMIFFLGNYSLIFGIGNLIKLAASFSLPVISILSPMWSLAVEEQFYLTWPFVLKRLKTPFQIGVVIVGLMVVSFVLRMILQKQSVSPGAFANLTFPNLIYTYSTFCHMDGLMAGAAIALLFACYDRFIPAMKRWTPLFFMGSIVILIGLMANGPSLSQNVFANVPLLTFLAIAYGGLVLSSLLSPLMAKFFSIGVLRDIGKVSYAMYIFHGGVIAIVHSHLKQLLPDTTWRNWLMIAACAYLATYILAKLSWSLLESRCLALRARFDRLHESSVAGAVVVPVSEDVREPVAGKA